MSDRGPLTIADCHDPAVVRERFQDVLDRYFLGDNPYAATAAWNALEYEVLRPLLTRIRELERTAH
jgi:hypothetical protein